jgi:hypothetical protein
MQILDTKAGDLTPGAVRIVKKPTWDSVVAGKPCGHRHKGTAAAEKCARERLNQRRTVRLSARDDCSQYVAPSEPTARSGTRPRGRKAN